MDKIGQSLPNSDRNGDKSPDELLALVYDELRKLAAVQMARNRPGDTLQPTALVHEAWLRLDASHNDKLKDPKYFFAAASQAMRHILIDHARSKLRARNGGQLERLDMDTAEIAAPMDDERLLQLDEQLDHLARIAPDKAQVVQLRFFVGLEAKETAEILGLSLRTVERYWTYSKAWLYARMTESQ